MRNIKIRELENTLEIYKDILSPCNCCTIKVAVAFLHDKGGKKRKPLNYIFPPRLASGLMDMARIQLETLKTELEELKKQDGEEPGQGNRCPDPFQTEGIGLLEGSVKEDIRQPF